jgi:uncharacterized membrane protein YphA (DoxX/SURF4 family)
MALAYEAGVSAGWRDIAILAGRIVLALVFAMGAFFKFADIGMTASYIGSVGFPFPLFFAWAAAIFETLVVIAFLTGLYMSEAALLSALYVVVLAFLFHLSGWDMASEIGQLKFGAFISHFPFAAGLLFAAACGPGRFGMRKSLI